MINEYQDIDTKQTILQHGQAVAENFKYLISFYEELLEKENVKQSYFLPLPKWFFEYKNELYLICKNKYEDIISYLILHDCGKPFCLEIDENGKRHFPNHSEISYSTFKIFYENKLIEDLILKDLLCHITKPKDFITLVNEKNIEILLISAIAAMHANSDMFGGIESDSFKIKFKNLEKLGKRILDYKFLKGEKND